jgi:WD40 repeat protein
MPTAPSRRLSSPFVAGILAAATLLSGCSSEPTGIPPELAKVGSPVPLSVSPSTLLLRRPGLSKTFTASVQYSGLLTASSSNPACATVSPTTTTSTEKPAGSSVNLVEFTVTSTGMGGCAITVTDKKGNLVSVRVSVSPIAFVSERDRPLEIYLIDADGQNPTRLTNDSDPTFNVHPAWSPDGAKIAFMSSLDGNEEIYVMDPDGQNRARLTNSPGSDDDEPAWSPDGGKIAFVSDRDQGNMEIYVMDADGQHPVNLTHSSGTEF